MLYIHINMHIYIHIYIHCLSFTIIFPFSSLQCTTLCWCVAFKFEVVVCQDMQIISFYQDTFIPSALQLADMLQVGSPVQAASSLILKPAPQLPSVDFQEICQDQFVENFTATHHLIKSGTWSNVHQELTAHIPWEEEGEENRSKVAAETP